MADMILSDGYSIVYDKPHNRIVIGLPPTNRTVTNTVQQIQNRKVNLDDSDLILLLEMAQYICSERRDKHGQ